MNKICTSIEQSKKLIELGIDINTADIWWNCRGALCAPLMYCEYPTCEKRTEKDIPAWSLVALLNVLEFPSLTQNKEDEWEICVPNCESDEYIEVSAVNPIDACVAIIIKLNELNLL